MSCIKVEWQWKMICTPHKFPVALKHDVISKDCFLHFYLFSIHDISLQKRMSKSKMVIYSFRLFNTFLKWHVISITYTIIYDTINRFFFVWYRFFHVCIHVLYHYVKDHPTILQSYKTLLCLIIFRKVVFIIHN